MELERGPGQSWDFFRILFLLSQCKVLGLFWIVPISPYLLVATLNVFNFWLKYKFFKCFCSFFYFQFPLLIWQKSAINTHTWMLCGFRFPVRLISWPPLPQSLTEFGCIGKLHSLSFLPCAKVDLPLSRNLCLKPTEPGLCCLQFTFLSGCWFSKSLSKLPIMLLRKPRLLYPVPQTLPANHLPRPLNHIRHRCHGKKSLFLKLLN